MTKFVEQPRVLDGDDGLSGEVLYQLDLLFGEGTNFLAGQSERSDQFVLLQQRDSQNEDATEFDRRNGRRMAFMHKLRMLQRIGYVRDLFRRQPYAQ